MWDAGSCDEYGGKDSDLHLAVKGGKDVPCNTQAYFDTLGGKLNMTVTCRSNDVVWGAYGANAVHFSILHEYVALASGAEQGVYRQFSNNYHSYIDRPDVQRLCTKEGLPIIPPNDAYLIGAVKPYKLIQTDLETWSKDMHKFFAAWEEGTIMDSSRYEDSFWSGVVVPMVNAHHYYKAKAISSALTEIKKCVALDWQRAATEWLQRRAPVVVC